MNNQNEFLDEDDDGFLEEDTTYNFRQLMDMIVLNKDVIFTIPSDQEEPLRAGLIMRKGRDNKMAIRRGLLPIDEVLSFNSYPAKDPTTKKQIKGQVCLRVKLAPRKSVTILNVEVPDNTF